MDDLFVFHLIFEYIGNPDEQEIYWLGFDACIFWELLPRAALRGQPVRVPPLLREVRESRRAGNLLAVLRREHLVAVPPRIWRG